MSGNASIVYVYNLNDSIVYAYNPLFPDQRVDIDKDVILDIQGGDNSFIKTELYDLLRTEYYEKYIK